MQNYFPLPSRLERENPRLWTRPPCIGSFSLYVYGLREYIESKFFGAHEFWIVDEGLFTLHCNAPADEGITCKPLISTQCKDKERETCSLAPPFTIGTCTNNELMTFGIMALHRPVASPSIKVGPEHGM